MPQAGRITWGELEIPQAVDTTFSKSGGFTSPGSLGAGRAYSIAKDGGIESAWAASDYWRDDFGRTVGSGSLGSADLGGAYTLSGTVADFSVSGGLGRLQGIDNYFAILNSVSADYFEITGRVGLDVLPVGNVLAFDILTRHVDNSNCYRCSIRFIDNGRVDALVGKFVGGAASTLSGPSTQLSTGTYTGGAFVRYRVKMQGSRIYFKVWLDGTSEPSTYGHIVSSLTDFPVGGHLGLRINTVGLSNTPEVRFDEIYTTVGAMGTGHTVTTFAKSGGMASTASTGATRTIQHSKSGGDETNASAVGPGARITQANKSGGITTVGSVGGSQISTGPIQRSGGTRSIASLGGSKSASFLKAGGINTAAKLGQSARGLILWSEFEIPRAVSTSFAKSGGISSAGSLGGGTVTANQFNRSGGFVSTARLGATKLVNLWSDWSLTRTYVISTQPVKIGGIIAPLSLGGARAQLYVKTSGPVIVGQLGATKAVIAVKSGGIQSVASLGGSSNEQQTIAKSGGMTSQASVGASRAFLVARAGGTTSQGVLGASKAYSTDKTGGVISRTILIGDVSISSAFAKTGGISTLWQSSGDKEVHVNKSGGVQSSFRLGANEIYKSGGIRSAANSGATRSIQHSKLAGTISSTSTSADKFVIFTKAAAGIESAGSIGADFAGHYPRDGGIISSLSLGGDPNVPERNIPVGGGFASSLSIGAEFLLQKPRTGGMVSTGRLGEHPNIGIRSAASLGGTVSFQLHIRPGAEDQILSVTVIETELISVSDHDGQAILLGGKL